ncbi:MAG: hypothetical protein U9R16_05470 [Campylobacterota bacterium]|nr:hypothetical protein [Campylobacterota bacterium]
MNITNRLESLIEEQNIDGVCVGDGIRTLKLNEVKEHFPIDPDTNVIGVINCSVWGPLKYGLIITEDGLIWRNQSSQGLRDNLSWSELLGIKNYISVDNSILNFGNYGYLDMQNSNKCTTTDAFNLMHTLSDFITNYQKTWNIN